MTLNWKRTMIWTALSSLFLLWMLMVAQTPALAYGNKGPDAVLYEVTEDMVLKNEAGAIVLDPALATRRTAVAQLSGFAHVGTPICPSAVLALAPNANRCVVNATGTDDVSLLTGKGTLSGTFAVVVQGDNETDAPEFVVMTGSFQGDIDLSLVLLGQAPLGFVEQGTVGIDTNGDGAADVSVPFTGTFRLPFALTGDGRRHRPSRSQRAYYLGDNDRPFVVEPDERSLGWPTVRLEISF